MNKSIVQSLTLNQLFPIRLGINNSIRIFWAFSFVVAISLLIVYIFQVNIFTQNRYLLKGYQSQLDKLVRESEALEINLSKVSSLANIDSYLQSQNFEKTNPNQIKYIRILESPVVKK